MKALVIGEEHVRMIEMHDVLAHEEYAAGLRAPELAEHQPHTFADGLLVVDQRRGFPSVNGVLLENLTRTEWTLLLYMAERPDRVIGHVELMTACWPPNYLDDRSGIVSEGEKKIVRITMHRLGQKLGLAGKLLQAVRGRGYRLLSQEPSS